MDNETEIKKRLTILRNHLIPSYNLSDLVSETESVSKQDIVDYMDQGKMLSKEQMNQILNWLGEFEALYYYYQIRFNPEEYAEI